ncbi:hypothetical protein L7F22_001023 [Adiantum nelumboides]|nr:hypothetical protein [Adiantum nelumboides]
MPCNHIAMIHENIQIDEVIPHVDEDVSQVPKTPNIELRDLPTIEGDFASSQCISIPSMEGEAVHALKSMANVIQDIHPSHEETLIGDSFLNLTGQDLLTAFDPINADMDSLPLQAGQQTDFQQAQHEDNLPTEHQKSHGSDPQQEKLAQVNKPDEQRRIVDLLRVPITEVCVRNAPREALVDYTNSLIITSSQYVESMRAKNAKKEELSKNREEKGLEKDKKRLRSLADKDERRRRIEDAVAANLSRGKWEIQQQHFEKQMRSILWENGSLNGLYIKPLHIDQYYQAMAGKVRLQKLRRSRSQA